jgi:hypothetical protein
MVSFTSWPLYPRGKETPLAPYRRLAEPQDQSEHRFLGRRAHSPVTIPTELFGPTFKSSNEMPRMPLPAVEVGGYCDHVPED